jgi:sterol desaturase/sphingolipid hydroxylase (fatty acid hydroxylase superfamily)
MKQLWQSIYKFFKPDKTKKHVKVDLVFVIFFAVIAWRVALNLFTNAGLIPLYLDFWNNWSFWFNIIGGIMALFGLVWVFRMYTRSLKIHNPTATDILTRLAYIPNLKYDPTFRELCQKYSVIIKK